MRHRPEPEVSWSDVPMSMKMGHRRFVCQKQLDNFGGPGWAGKSSPCGRGLEEIEVAEDTYQLKIDRKTRLLQET